MLLVLVVYQEIIQLHRNKHDNNTKYLKGLKDGLSTSKSSKRAKCSSKSSAKSNDSLVIDSSFSESSTNPAESQDSASDENAMSVIEEDDTSTAMDTSFSSASSAGSCFSSSSASAADLYTNTRNYDDNGKFISQQRRVIILLFERCIVSHVVSSVVRCCIQLRCCLVSRCVVLYIFICDIVRFIFISL